MNPKKNEEMSAMLKVLIEMNKSLVREQYKQLKFIGLPKNMIEPPYHFYLN